MTKKKSKFYFDMRDDYLGRRFYCDRSCTGKFFSFFRHGGSLSGSCFFALFDIMARYKKFAISIFERRSFYRHHVIFGVCFANVRPAAFYSE